MSRANSNSSRTAADAKSGKSGTSRTSGTGTEKVPEQVTDKGLFGAGTIGAGTIGAGTIGAGTIGEGTVSRARINRLRNSMPGKDALIDELIDLFVADLWKRLGAIAHAVERADAPALALQAHALRGGAANFGASRLDELCAKIEEAGVRGRFAETPAMLEEVRRESARVRDVLLTLKIRAFI
jgi:HPt (histidine-containing phosphotransfer) domain-containing protein